MIDDDVLLADTTLFDELPGFAPDVSVLTLQAMRVLPVVSLMGRVTGAEPVKVGGVTVPPHTIVATPLFSIQNSYDNWEKPREFRPER